MSDYHKQRLDIKHFINPYTFYPLADKKKDYKETEEKNVSGKITVEIQTKTPLFIPHSGTEHAFCVSGEGEKHKSYDFFSYSEVKEGMNLKEENPEKSENLHEPVIPASEIRGMIRSVYEAVTDSCMSAVNENAMLFKRTNDYYKPGLITWKGQKLCLVTDIDIYKLDKENVRAADEEFQEGQVVFFAYKIIYKQIKTKKGVQKIPVCYVTHVSGEKSSGLENSGYLIKGEVGPPIKGKSKHNYSVFAFSRKKIEEAKKQNKQILDILDTKELTGEMIDSLEIVLKSYSDERINKNIKSQGHGGYREYAEKWHEFKRKKQGYFPVYYSVLQDAGEVKGYLSPACITKEAYHNTIKKILNKHGEFQPCDGTRDLCAACELFGMIGISGKTSSLRFADARLVRKNELKNVYMSPQTLQELSQPKLSSTEFYLKRPEKDAVFWTYDYKVVGKNVVFCEDEVQLSGRKFYWHSIDKKDYEFFPSVEANDRNKTVRPIHSGIIFSEDVYFDRISLTQLKQLLAILNISCNNTDKKERGYKLGTGKPLGLGSITMKVTNCIIRDIRLDRENIEVIYEEIPYKEYTNEEIPKLESDEKKCRALGFSKERIVMFLRITDFDAAKGYSVTYPVTEKQLRKIQRGYAMTEGFKWSVENRGGKIRARNQTRFKEWLPELTENGENSMPAFQEQEGGFGNSKGYGKHK